MCDHMARGVCSTMSRVLSPSASLSPARECVSPHLRCLRWCGFCRLPLSTRGSLRNVHSYYCLAVLIICCIYLVQECIYAYQERGDMEKLSKVMFLLLCHVTSIAKQVVFYLEADVIDTMISEFDDPLLNLRACGGAEALRATAVGARRLQRAYSGCAVCTCALWLVFPVARFLHHQPVEFAFHLPAAFQTLQYRAPVFASVLLYSFYVTTLVGIANTTMDAFIGTILYQCTTQIKILRRTVETVIETSLEESKCTKRDFESILMEQFRNCLLHYNKIIKISTSLQNVFGTAILIQFTIGGWILCMAAYKMVSLTVLSVEFASMTLFITCILTELFLYCFFGNELTYESTLLLDSLYACGWERGGWGRGGRFPRTLLLAGERARRPLRAAAARLVPLSLETFLKILKSSYTFYAVLRQTKQ